VLCAPGSPTWSPAWLIQHPDAVLGVARRGVTVAEHPYAALLDLITDGVRPEVVAAPDGVQRTSPYDAIALLQDWLERHASMAIADHHPTRPERLRLRHRASFDALSVVIPSAGAATAIDGSDVVLVVNLVDELRVHSPEISDIVVVEGSNRPLAQDVRDGLRERSVRVVTVDTPTFNFSLQVNAGVLATSSSSVLLCNDDIAPTDGDWLPELAGWLSVPGLGGAVGAVGATLVYPDGAVQCSGHSHHHGAFVDGHGLGVDALLDDRRLGVVHEAPSTSAACMLVRRSAFDDVGGMRLSLPHSYNDVDLGIKLRRRGWSVLVSPYARITHLESVSRDPAVQSWEIEELISRWRDDFDGDPFVRHGPITG
jgi:GT2 family glycosyltransferase